MVVTVEGKVFKLLFIIHVIKEKKHIKLLDDSKLRHVQINCRQVRNYSVHEFYNGNLFIEGLNSSFDSMFRSTTTEESML